MIFFFHYFFHYSVYSQQGEKFSCNEASVLVTGRDVRFYVRQMV